MKLKPEKNSVLNGIWEMDGLIAQSVEHCIGIAEDMGSNPVEA